MKNILLGVALFMGSVAQASYPGAPGSNSPVNVNVQTEDRGDVIVQTITTSYAVDSVEFCIVKSVVVTEKATGTVLSNQTESNCTSY